MIFSSGFTRRLKQSQKLQKAFSVAIRLHHVIQELAHTRECVHNITRSYISNEKKLKKIISGDLQTFCIPLGGVSTWRLIDWSTLLYIETLMSQLNISFTLQIRHGSH